MCQVFHQTGASTTLCAPHKVHKQEAVFFTVQSCQHGSQHLVEVNIFLHLYETLGCLAGLPTFFSPRPTCKNAFAVLAPIFLGPPGGLLKKENFCSAERECSRAAVG